MSSRSCEAAVRHHGTHISDEAQEEAALVIMMRGDSASEPNVLVDDRGLCVFILLGRPHSTAGCGKSVLLALPRPLLMDM